MATFKVKLGSSDGELTYRQVHGQNAAEVRRQCQNEGFFVFSVKPVFNLPSLVGIRRAIPTKTFLLFNKEFRGLVKAGLPIVEGLDVLLKHMAPNTLRTLLEGVQGRLRAGESLSQAFRAYGEMIPSYYSALLFAGEQSGNLADVLTRFITQEERLRKARKRFVQSLTYPAILICVALICGYVVLTRAMPQFMTIYANSNKELPWITQVLMSTSDFVVTWYPWLFALLALTVVASHMALQTDPGKALLERGLLRIPLLGKMWKLQNQNTFARTMRMLLEGGITVPQALSITADALPSPAVRGMLRATYADLVQGKSFHEALEEHAQLDAMVGEMVRVGESTGTLGDMLDYLAEAGEERSEDYLELISSMLAPMLLLMVGLLIAFMVVAMYLPMFGSYDYLGG